MSERQVAVIVGVLGCVGLVLVSPILFTVAMFLYFAMAGMIAETGLIANDVERLGFASLVCLTPVLGFSVAFLVFVVVMLVQSWRNRKR